MPHDPLASVNHMLNHAREAQALAVGRSRADLDTDRTLAMLLTHPRRNACANPSLGIYCPTRNLTQPTPQ